MVATSTTNPAAVKRRAETAERVFNRLVEAIVTGQFASGLPMREAEIAKKWGVSRTPMREAVRRAAEAGLLVLRRNRAPLVRAFTAHDVECLYKMREALELLALEEAWGHIPPDLVRRLRTQAEKAEPWKSRDWIDRCLAFDGELHNAWVEHCRNPWLAQSLRRIWTFIRILQRVMARDPGLVQRSYGEHRLIVDCLTGPRLRPAQEHLRRHIRNSGAAVQQLETVCKPGTSVG